MATLVIFNKYTDSVIYAQGGYQETSDPDAWKEIVFDRQFNGALPIDDHVARIIPGDMLQHEFIDSMYVSGGVIQSRSYFEPVVSSYSVPADDTTQIVISNLPTKTDIKVLFEGEVIAESANVGGSETITFDMEGEYLIMIMHEEYKTWEGVFHGT